jgi:hypothetical protein
MREYQEEPKPDVFNVEFDFDSESEIPEMDEGRQEPTDIQEILESRANNDGFQSVIKTQYKHSLEDRLASTRSKEALVVVAEAGIATQDDELAHAAFLQQDDVGKWQTWAYAVKNGSSDLADSPAWKAELSLADQNKAKHYKISESKIEGTAHLWGNSKGKERAELGTALSELVDNVEPSPGYGSARYDRTKGIAYDLMKNGAFNEAEKIINGETKIEIDNFMEGEPLSKVLPLFKASHGVLSWKEARKLKNDTEFPEAHKQVLSLISSRNSKGKSEAIDSLETTHNSWSRYSDELNSVLEEVSPQSTKYKYSKLDESNPDKAAYIRDFDGPEPDQIRSFFKADKPEAAVSYWHSVIDQAAETPGMQPPKEMECTVAMLENRQEVDKLSARNEIEFIDLKIQLGFIPFSDGTTASEISTDPTSALFKMIDLADGMPDLQKRLETLKETNELYGRLNMTRRINSEVGERLKEAIAKASRTNRVFGLAD